MEGYSKLRKRPSWRNSYKADELGQMRSHGTQRWEEAQQRDRPQAANWKVTLSAAHRNHIVLPGFQGCNCTFSTLILNVFFLIGLAVHVCRM